MKVCLYACRDCRLQDGPFCISSWLACCGTQHAPGHKLKSRLRQCVLSESQKQFVPACTCRTYTVSWRTETAGTYLVEAQFEGIALAGCPASCQGQRLNDCPQLCQKRVERLCICRLTLLCVLLSASCTHWASAFLRASCCANLTAGWDWSSATLDTSSIQNLFLSHDWAQTIHLHIRTPRMITESSAYLLHDLQCLQCHADSKGMTLQHSSSW